MKTAVSIPDELFRRADVLAQRLGKSRSQVYREALAEYVERREPDAVTRAINESLKDIDPQMDEWFFAAQRQAVERIEWQ
jgi:predicted transcriptional regulator